jgi:glucosamine kinase
VRDDLTWAGLTLVGLDIGGSRSRARLWAGGRIAAESEGRSASLPAAGPDAAKAALAALLAGLSLDPAQPADAICAGTAGLSVPGAHEFLHEQLAPLTRSGLVLLVSDASLVLPAAGLDAGIAVICGTGSVAVGIFQARAVQAGGWGYLLGDEGSGYWVARQAVRQLAERHDSHLPLGELGTAVLGATGCPDFSSLFQLWYDRRSPGAWAVLAPLVLDCQDPFSRELTEAAAAALASIIATVYNRLGNPPGLPVLLAGGLLTHHQALADRTLAAVRSVVPAARPSVASEPPVAGAVQLALQAAGGGRLR